MRRFRRPDVILSAIVAAAVVAGCGSSSGSTSSGASSAGSSSTTSSSPSRTSSKPIVIGAAVDFSGLMAPVDDPAYYAAELEIKKINAAGGVDGRKLVLKSGNTKSKPASTRSVALNLVSNGADILWVTCDVDLGTPAITVGLSSKLLTISPCISTDQMGPKRFGSLGDMAFSFGNVAQDEGAADAQIAIKQGWKTADVVTDNSLVYFTDVCQAFTNKFKALGGKIVSQLSWTQGDHTIGNVATRVNSTHPETIQTCAVGSEPDLSTFLSDVRSTGNMTPLLGSWALDGTYWLPKNPKISTNIWSDDFASVYGDDPSPAVRALVAQLTAEGHPPVLGGFMAGASAIDGIVAAIKDAGGSTDGSKLASIMQKFHDLPTISGDVSFSPQLHTVFGREYRVLEVVNGKGHFEYLIKSGGLAQIPG